MSKMTYRFVVLISVLTCSLLSKWEAKAQLIAYDGFDYSANSLVAGLNGGSGWAGGWEYNGPGSDSIIGSDSLIYGGLALSGKCLQTTSTNPVANSRPLATTLGVSGTTVYYGILMRPLDPWGVGSPDTYFGFNDGPLYFGVGGGEKRYHIGRVGGSPLAISNVTMQVNQTVFLVVRVTFRDGNDTEDLFVNPPVGRPLPAIPDATYSNFDQGSIPYMGMGGSIRVQYDEFRVGYTYADVIPTKLVIPLLFDLNGDNKNDLLFQNSVTGAVAYWFLDGTTLTTNGVVWNGTDNQWKVVATPDINGDNKPDVLLQYQSNGDYPKGSVYYWQLNGSAITHSGLLWKSTDSNWQVMGTLQINGSSVVILQHSLTGAVYYWKLNSDFTIGTNGYIFNGNLPGWKVVACPDWHLDGNPGILLQNQTTGSVYYWNLNADLSLGTNDYIFNGHISDWKIVGIADVNQDGWADIILQNQTTGAVYYWHLDSTRHLMGQGYFWLGGDANWKVKSVTDLTNSGNVSLVFQHALTGGVYYWNLNGLTIGTNGYLYNALTNWNLVAPR